MKDNIFREFPKTNSVLLKEYQDRLFEEGIISRHGKTFMTILSQKLESWLHYKIAKNTTSQADILELGAGTLNHIPWQKPYKTYDIVEPQEHLYKDSPYLDKINFIYESAYDINNTHSYDNIISIAVLEHILDLPMLVAYNALLLRENGKLLASIPSQGSLAWLISYNLTTGLSYYLRNKLNYNVIMKHFHVNTCKEIESVIKYFFDDVKVSRFPLPVMNMSVYTFIKACKPNIYRCNEYIKLNKQSSTRQKF